MKNVIIYTDGACSGNPGPGGYGSVLIYKDNIKKISGGYENTTNNRMEMMAVIEGLKILKKPCNVDLFSDSKYIIDAINLGWAKKWKNNNWMRNKKDKALNVDLWKEIFNQLEIHNVNFNWVKGHAGNKYNEICDEIATNYILHGELLEDVNYID